MASKKRRAQERRSVARKPRRSLRDDVRDMINAAVAALKTEIHFHNEDPGAHEAMVAAQREANAPLIQQTETMWEMHQANQKSAADKELRDKRRNDAVKWWIGIAAIVVAPIISEIYHKVFG